MKHHHIIIGIVGLLLYMPACMASDDSLVSFRWVCGSEQRTKCSKETTENEELFVQNQPFLTLADVASASVGELHDKDTLYLRFKDKEVFEKITSQNIGKRLAVFIHNKLITAPVIVTPIPGGGVNIAMSREEAKSLADEINKAVSK